MVSGGRKHTLFILRIIVLNSCPKIIGSNLIELFFARYFLKKINRKKNNSWLLPNEQACGKMTCKQLYFFQEKLGKALKGQKDCWMPCLMHASWLPMPFIVFELIDNPVSYRKLKILQIIPLYRNANELSPVKCNSLFPRKQSSFASTCTFISSFLIVQIYVSVNSPLN